MIRPVLFAASAMTIALAVAGCDGGRAAEAGPATSGTAAASVTTTTETAASTSPPSMPVGEGAGPDAGRPVEGQPAPPVEGPVADPCAEVTREYLITTLRMTGMPQYPLADLQQARCSGNFASAMAYPEGTLHPVMYLFEYSEQNGYTHWRVIDVGEGLDCVNRHGVPADVGSAIGCAS